MCPTFSAVCQVAMQIWIGSRPDVQNVCQTGAKAMVGISLSVEIVRQYVASPLKNAPIYLMQ